MSEEERVTCVDTIRKTLESLVYRASSRERYDHECALHYGETPESCEELTEARKREAEASDALEEAFDDLAKCLGRITK
jgi:DNA repair ATPase RecN